MKKNIELLDGTKGASPAIINTSEIITFFDELEYSCWDLFLEYAKAFGIDLPDEIDFATAKAIQNTIIKLFEDAGVTFEM